MSSDSEIEIERNELGSIIKTLRDGVIVYDANFKILIFNPAAEEIFRVNAKEITGKHMSPDNIKNPRLKLITQTFFPSLAPLVVNRSESGFYPQITDISLEEEKIELRSITDKITDKNSRFLGYVKVVIDKSREVELMKAKNEFISIAAHQLRTPLTAVNWTFESLNGEKISASQKSLVNTGLEASALMLKIVNDLLDVSKIEEGHFGYDFEDVNLIDFVKEVIKEAKDMADQSSVKIYLKEPKTPLILKIDSQKLGMVLFNLIDNAVKYNVENGEVVVSVECLKDKPFVQISVKDTGIGMNKSDLEKMFKKFFRADNAVKAIPNGSGLGLYIAKNIIKRHGGEIWAESEINRGSTFYFTLPIDKNLIPSKEFVYGEE